MSDDLTMWFNPSCSKCRGAGELLEDLVAPRGAVEGVFDLPQRHGEVLFAARAERLSLGPLPQLADDRGPRELLARLADERAVAHLGKHRLEVGDVRRFVAADVRH